MATAVDAKNETFAAGEELSSSYDSKPNFTQNRRVLIRRKASRKNDVPFAMFREWIVQNQIGEWGIAGRFGILIDQEF